MKKVQLLSLLAICIFTLSDSTLSIRYDDQCTLTYQRTG